MPGAGDAEKAGQVGGGAAIWDGPGTRWASSIVFCERAFGTSAFGGMAFWLSEPWNAAGSRSSWAEPSRCWGRMITAWVPP